MSKNNLQASGRFFSTLTLSVLLGFGSGAVGTLIATVYFAPAPVTVSVTPASKPTLAVNRVEAKRLASPEEVTRATATFFEAKDGTDLKVAYRGAEAVSAGMSLTSDGWVVAMEEGLKVGHRGDSMIVRVDGRLYPVTDAITDPYSGAAFFKVDAHNLPVVALAKSTEEVAPGDSLFGIDTTGGVRRLEVVNTAAGGQGDEAVRVSERLSRFIMTEAQPALPLGSMVLSDLSEVIGLVAAQTPEGTFIAPIDTWRDVVDSVLKGNGAQRPYFGLSYLDLAEGGLTDDDGRQERGASVTAVAKDSPAAKAGLRVDDVILAVNGEPVSARNPLSAIVSAYIPGMNVVVSYRRAGLDRQADVALVTAPNLDKK